MAASSGAGLSKAQLKDKVRAIILLQGNDFIKELLRDHGIKIGSTKNDFANNIAEAIDAGALTQEMIEAWLYEIEGWGNQHVYLFEAPGLDHAALGPSLAASEHARLIGAPPSYNFPSDLELSSVLHDARSVSFLWHLGREGWDRARAKDFVKDEGLETYRYEAYRRRMDRSVVRFEWRFDDSHCAILIQRNRDIDHGVAMSVVWGVLQRLSIITAPLRRLSLTQAVKSASKEKGTRSTRFEAEGGFVDLVSTLDDGGIDRVAAVRHARHSLNDDEFERAQGIFALGEAEKLAQKMSVQVFGSEGRIRLLAQCRRDDVHSVIAYLLGHNQADAGI
jgi:hypothetical protein